MLQHFQAMQWIYLVDRLITSFPRSRCDAHYTGSVMWITVFKLRGRPSLAEGVVQLPSASNKGPSRCLCPPPARSSASASLPGFSPAPAVSRHPAAWALTILHGGRASMCQSHTQFAATMLLALGSLATAAGAARAEAVVVA